MFATFFPRLNHVQGAEVAELTCFLSGCLPSSQQDSLKERQLMLQRLRPLLSIMQDKYNPQCMRAASGQQVRSQVKSRGNQC